MAIAVIWALAGMLSAAQPSTTAGPVAPVDDNERFVMADAARLLAEGEPDLAKLDALVARLPRPTPLRGRVQAMRAMKLSALDRNADAVAASEEAIRILPDDAFVLWTGAWVQTFGGSPVKAVESWLRAAELDPERIRQTEPYLVYALAGRLRDLDETARADRLDARAGELNLTTVTPSQRSDQAMARLRIALDAGNEATAAALIPEIIDPFDLARLYLSKDYAPLWPAIAAYADADLGSAQRRYLETLRRGWWTGRDLEAATDYARALRDVDRPDLVVALFEPLLSAAKLTRYDERIEFLAPVVASSLNLLGRPVEALALIDRVERLIPSDQSALALNLSAARITLASSRAQWGRVVTLALPWLAAARAQGAGVNPSATMSVQGMLACAYEKLGRTAEAAEAASPIVAMQRVQFGLALTLFACRDDLPAARTLIEAMLKDPARRRQVAGQLLFPVSNRYLLPEGAAARQFRARLRADPAVRTAIAAHFRMLELAALRRLPDGFDALQEGPMAKPKPGSI